MAVPRPQAATISTAVYADVDGPPGGLYPSDVDAPITPHAEAGLPKTVAPRALTWWRVAAIGYVLTCGSPAGIEEVVIAGGTLGAFAGILAMPLVYCLPQILTVCEVTSMMPSNAAFILVGRRAFGSGVGFYMAWMIQIANALDVATYPIVVGDYAVTAFHPTASYTARISYRVAALVVGVFIALLSSRNISTVMALSTFTMIMMIFIVFFIAIPHLQPESWVEPPVSGQVNVALLMSSLIYLYSGWSALAAISGETRTHGAMIGGCFTALGLGVTTYLIGFFAAASYIPAHTTWTVGIFNTAFNAIVPGIGPYFGGAVMAANLFLLVAALMLYSRVGWGMAKLGWAPAVTRKELDNGAPVLWIAALSILAFVFLWFHLGSIFIANFVFAGTVGIIYFCAFLRLRYSEPDAPRPFKVPGGFVGAWLVTLVKVALFGTVVISGLCNLHMLAAFLVANVVIIAAYFIYRRVCPYDADDANAPGSSDDARPSDGASDSTKLMRSGAGSNGSRGDDDSAAEEMPERKASAASLDSEDLRQQQYRRATRYGTMS